MDGRTARSRRTRRRIVEAATRRFTEQGFIGATIEDVADNAGVSVQSIYYSFGTKLRLLHAVLDTSVAGALDGDPLNDQTWLADACAAPDATTAIRRAMTGATAIVARTAPVYEVIRQASADPQVRELLDTNRTDRRRRQRDMLELFAAAGHLTPAQVATGADPIYALVNEETWAMLTEICGWDQDRYAAWAGDEACLHLGLGPGEGAS